MKPSAADQNPCPGFDLRGYLEGQQRQVNRRLETLLKNPDTDDNRLIKAMIYSLLAGGKRLRPILCLAAAEAVSGASSRFMDAACALEMIHTYSLIHDDLPAMDDDTLRRGKPTCHVAFDEATAILAGDALLTLAFEILSTGGGPAENRLEAIGILARAAGYRGMIDGQMRDMAAEGLRLSLEELEALHRKKTGALIEAAVRIGAILAGAARIQIPPLTRYGQCIGLAFQIVDDILNVEGDPSVLGKAVGTDRERLKNTYPALLGLEQSKRLARKTTDQALQAIETFDNRADPLRAIAWYVFDRNH